MIYCNTFVRPSIRSTLGSFFRSFVYNSFSVRSIIRSTTTFFLTPVHTISQFGIYLELGKFKSVCSSKPYPLWLTVISDKRPNAQTQRELKTKNYIGKIVKKNKEMSEIGVSPNLQNASIFVIVVVIHPK